MAGRIRSAGGALAAALLYFFAYRLAWMNSADQFFLPAGLRVACLLFLPYRLWPSIFVGDAAAMLSMRLPIAEAQGIGDAWPYVSSALLSPLLGTCAFLVRKLMPSVQLQHRALPAMLLPAALFGVSTNTALNALLGYPLPDDLVSYIYRFTVGQYLAILIAVLPIVLWKRPPPSRKAIARLGQHALIASGTIVCAYFAADAVSEPWQRLVVMGCMLLPIFGLTALHGWRGAAIGIVVANLAVGFSVPTTNMLGNQDISVFVVQQTLAVVCTLLLIVGSLVTVASDRVRRVALSALESRALAREHAIQTEQALRDRAEAIAIVQNRINAENRETVQQLKESGHYELAMQINARSLTNTQLMSAQAAALYPFHIERVGLYGALREPDFQRAVGGTVDLQLRGDLIHHSITIQVATYRGICYAVENLESERQAIHVRAWSIRGERGISVRVVALAAPPSHGSAKSRKAAALLAAKMHAYGGVSKRRRRSLFFVLGDGDHFLARGTTIQNAPLLLSNTLMAKSSEL